MTDEIKVNELRICADCRHSKPDKNVPKELEFLQCFAPLNVRQNSVTGKHEAVITYCQTQRKDYGVTTTTLCGPEGKWFEPKDGFAAPAPVLTAMNEQMNQKPLNLWQKLVKWMKS